MSLCIMCRFSKRTRANSDDVSNKTSLPMLGKQKLTKQSSETSYFDEAASTRSQPGPTESQDNVFPDTLFKVLSVAGIVTDQAEGVSEVETKPTHTPRFAYNVPVDPIPYKSFRSKSSIISNTLESEGGSILVKGPTLILDVFNDMYI